MPLEAPKLDSRQFKDIYAQARSRIPQYTPEWTDFNDSDPGIALTQLFAWLTETMLYEMNRLPELNYIKFLQLIDLELQAAQPAKAHLTFVPDGKTGSVGIPERVKVEAESADGAPVVFETESGLDLIGVPLKYVQVYDRGVFTDVTLQNVGATLSYRPFGFKPKQGNALYLGFEVPEHRDQMPLVFPERLSFYVFLPPPSDTDTAQSIDEAIKPLQAPVKLVWEYKNDLKSNRWVRLDTQDDKSVGLTHEGYIYVAGRDDIVPTVEGVIPEACYWLRCRVDGNPDGAGWLPEVDFIRPNVVDAISLTTVLDEIVGTSEGEPSQQFQLAHRPVYPNTLSLVVVPDEASGDPTDQEEAWEQVEDFLASQRGDPVYKFNNNTGVITLGDGAHGVIPFAGSQLIARQYRYGGGQAANVAVGQIASLQAPVSGVDSVINERPTVGGQDEQTLDDLKQQAPEQLRSRGRAITKDDFTALAKKAPGVAKATVIPNMHPHYPDFKVPGALTVVILPDTDELPPIPSADLIRAVANYLDDKRLIGSEVYVKGPAYTQIQIEATVEVEPYASFDRVKQDILARVQHSKYLDPRQQEFGKTFYPTSLYSEIQAADLVRAVTSLVVYDATHQPITNAFFLPPDGLIFGKDHDITLVPGT